METRQRIIEEAMRHVERYGRKRTRLVAMAEDLGMSHANIYRHFKNKSQILDAIVIDWLTQADGLIAESIAAAETPKQAVTTVVVVLNRFLRNKLSSEPAAPEIFAHAFSDQPESIAAHLVNLKQRIGENVIAHSEASAEASVSPELITNLLVTTLENFLNPLLINERDSATDTEQLELLIDRLLV